MKHPPFTLSLSKGVLFALLLGASACGGRGAIFLTIEGSGPEGTLKAPDDVDKLVVKVSNPEGTNTLLEKEYPLGPEQKFPLTLGLEPGGQTGARVRIAVDAFKAEQKMAETSAVVPIHPQEVTSVTLRIQKE